MTTFQRGDCVRIGRGPGGTFPSDPSLVGLQGTWQGLTATVGIVEGEPPSPVSICWIAFPDSDHPDVMIESEFVGPCG